MADKPIKLTGNEAVFNIEDYVRAKELIAHAQAQPCACILHLRSMFACKNCMAVLMAAAMCEARGERDAALALFDPNAPKA